MILNNFCVINKKDHQVKIIKSNGVTFGEKYFQSKKILTALFNWSYGIQWLWGKSFFYFGVNENKTLMYFPLKKIYNLFIVDKKQQFTIEYNNKYLFKEIFNDNNIIYIINNKPQGSIEAHGKFLINYLENCLVQSKINKKNLVVFMYYQLENFLHKHDEKIMKYLKILIKNSVGYYNIILVEKTSQILVDFFYHNKESFMDYNSALLLNGVDSMAHSNLILGSYGYENTPINIFKNYEETYGLVVPNDDHKDN